MSAQIEVFEKQCQNGQLDAHDIEQRVSSLWQSDPAMRAEFTSVESAIAYFAALARGNVRRLVGAGG